MYVSHLALTNFRNYAHLELDLTPGITLIWGGNACGKTSLLEAIFYLATGRSPHASAERELIRWGASTEPIPFARVETQVVKRNDVRTHLEIVLVQPAERTNGTSERQANRRVNKRIKVNGVSKRAMDLLGELNAVLFLPNDLDLVFGAPSDRRRYLDITLSQIDSRYGRALVKYHHVVEQRNSLLREFRERTPNLDALAIWDRQLIEEGTYLIARRAETIERYNEIVAELHARLTDQREQLQLVYQPSVAIHTTTPSGIAQQFSQQLAALRPRELGAATTLLGPHRDDLRFLITRHPDATPIDATTYASRGQGRTVALSLKLAEGTLMRRETGEDPILLLDDVMSELDQARRDALTRGLPQSAQAIITTTDLNEFSAAFRENVRVLHICDGTLRESPGF